MDFDGDGRDDVLTGSYWPGHLYLFRGIGDGTYEKGRILEDAKGEKLHAGGTWKSDDEPDMDSLAAVPFAVDHDGDGDLDLLVGNISGRVILIPNEGTSKKPAYNREKRRALEVKVEGDAGPVVADWDQDGTPDLLVGAGDGAVTFFRNTGSRREPVYAAGAKILPASKTAYANPVPHGAAPEGPGMRTKVSVTDWNGDGKLDLLVGDFWYEKPEERKLTAAQERELAELKELRDRITREYSELYRKLGKEAKGDERIRKLQKELSDVYEKLSKLEPRATPHGSVWLYLRKRP